MSQKKSCILPFLCLIDFFIIVSSQIVHLSSFSMFLVHVAVYFNISNIQHMAYVKPIIYATKYLEIIFPNVHFISNRLGSFVLEVKFFSFTSFSFIFFMFIFYYWLLADLSMFMSSYTIVIQMKPIVFEEREARDVFVTGTMCNLLSYLYFIIWLLLLLLI